MQMKNEKWATAKNDQDPFQVFKKMYFHNLNYQEIVLYCSFHLINVF